MKIQLFDATPGNDFSDGPGAFSLIGLLVVITSAFTITYQFPKWK